MSPFYTYNFLNFLSLIFCGYILVVELFIIFSSNHDFPLSRLAEKASKKLSRKNCHARERFIFCFNDTVSMCLQSGGSFIFNVFFLLHGEIFLLLHLSPFPQKSSRFFLLARYFYFKRALREIWWKHFARKFVSRLFDVKMMKHGMGNKRGVIEREGETRKFIIQRRLTVEFATF